MVRPLIAAAGAAALLLAPASAATVQQVDLTGLCRAAHRIFRGTVVRIETGTISAGGGELPFIEYTVAVEDALKGEFERLKGVPVARVRMLGKLPASTRDGIRRLRTFPGLPRLVRGDRYLLFTTRPGWTGLSTTVGLGQGCFRIAGEPGDETAVNEFDNRGLFRSGEAGAGTATGIEAPATGGPLLYADLADAIRRTLAGMSGPQ